MTRRQKWLLLATIFPFLVASCLILGFLPETPTTLRAILSLAWAGVVSLAILRSRNSRVVIGIPAGGIVLIFAFHFLRSPADARDWVVDQERTVAIEIMGDEARIDNLRNTVYRTDGTVETREWYSDRFRINAVERVDYVHEILSANGVIAHGFLSFAFTDGRHLAISVEARRRKGQTYHPLPGLFRNYELIYILGPETDLIGTRANVRQNPVYVYPIRTDRAAAQALFRSMLLRADHLARHPEFYHTISNNCVSSILLHVDELSPVPFRRDLRILLPGTADELLFERGLIAFEGLWDEARPRFQINSRSAPAADPDAW